jgi:hypothetical protein
MRLINKQTVILDSIETVHRNKDGKILSKRILNNGRIHRTLRKLGLVHDSITSAGMAIVAGLLLVDVGGTAFDYIAIGTGTTAAAVGDDATYTHECEAEEARKAAVGTRVQTTYANDTAQLVATFAAADGLTGTAMAITEVIVSNGAVVGVTLLRQKYSPADTMNWDQGDTLQVTVKVQVKQGA